MSTKKKAAFLIVLIMLMITYVGWVFYMSEPTYVDGAQIYGREMPVAGETALYPLHTYDFIVIPKTGSYYSDAENPVMTGLVLQNDNKHALVKIIEGNSHHSEPYYDMILDKSHYRIIGRGTIYHKVNHYIGFNIMMITQMIIGVLIAVLVITTTRLLRSIFFDLGIEK